MFAIDSFLRDRQHLAESMKVRDVCDLAERIASEVKQARSKAGKGEG